jgi:hypothetical protein
MDIIENGVPSPRPRRRTAVWVAVVVVGLGGLYWLRQATESRQPNRHPAVASTTPPPLPLTEPTPAVDVPIATATVPPDLIEKAMHTLPQEHLKGGMELIGSNFANGQASTGFEDDTVPGKGTYDVTVVCLGVGGVDVTVFDPEPVEQPRPTIIRLVCTGKADSGRITLTNARVFIEFNPDPETVASVAYAMTPVKR